MILKKNLKYYKFQWQTLHFCYFDSESRHLFVQQKYQTAAFLKGKTDKLDVLQKPVCRFGFLVFWKWTKMLQRLSLDKTVFMFLFFMRVIDATSAMIKKIINVVYLEKNVSEFCRNTEKVDLVGPCNISFLVHKPPNFSWRLCFCFVLIYYKNRLTQSFSGCTNFTFWSELNTFDHFSNLVNQTSSYIYIKSVRSVWYVPVID